MFDINEIVNRPSGSKVGISAMMYVIKAYIKEKKGRDIDINLEKNLHRSHPLFNVVYQNQLKKLNDAYGYASQYFLNVKTN